MAENDGPHDAEDMPGTVAFPAYDRMGMHRHVSTRQLTAGITGRSGNGEARLEWGIQATLADCPRIPANRGPACRPGRGLGFPARCPVLIIA